MDYKIILKDRGKHKIRTVDEYGNYHKYDITDEKFHLTSGAIVILSFENDTVISFTARHGFGDRDKYITIVDPVTATLPYIIELAMSRGHWFVNKIINNRCAESDITSDGIMSDDPSNHLKTWMLIIHDLIQVCEVTVYDN